MYIKGSIEKTWSLDEIENLPYFYEPFNDPHTVEQWQQQYGMTFNIGVQADWRVSQPGFVNNVIEQLVKQNIKLSNIGTSFYRMDPGNLLPRHQDRYVSYCKYHNVDADQVWRVIVFLQDWNPGFLFEIDSTSVANYPAGTYVCWHYDTPHMAGNLGSIPRYTLQITGTRHD